MPNHRLLRACLPVVLATCTVTVASPAADAADTTVLGGVVLDSVDVVARGHVAGLPGDTQYLQFSSLTVEPAPRSPGFYVSSYRCDGWDPDLAPFDQDCTHLAAGFRPLADFRFDRPAENVFQVHGTSELGPLDLTLVGQDHVDWVSRQWRHAEGRARERGRTVSTLYRTSIATGTLGAVTLEQPAEVRDTWSTVNTTRTGQRSSTGRPVPLPAVGAPGAGTWDAYTQGRGTAIWARPLGPAATAPAGTSDFEVGQVELTKGGRIPEDDLAYLMLSTQRCGPGERPAASGQEGQEGFCDQVSDLGVGTSAEGTFDADGNATLTGHVIQPDGTTTPLQVTWHGRRPIGVDNLDTAQPDHTVDPSTWATSGIRWTAPDVQITYGGVQEPVFSAALSLLSSVRR